MRNLLSLLISLIATPCFCQQHLIKYDALSHQANYYQIKQKDTLSVKKINLPGSGQLLLQVENYNPFYWDARVTAIKDESGTEQSFADVFNPISVLAGSFGDLMSGLPKLDMQRDRGVVNKDEYDKNSYNFLIAVHRYSTLYEKVQKLTTNLDSLQIARLRLQELKTNINLTAADIKSSARNIVQNALHTDKPGLETVLEIGKKNDLAFASLVSEASALSKEIKTLQPLVNPTAEYNDKTLTETGDEVSQSFSALNKLAENQPLHPNIFMEEAATVVNTYNEIASASFRFDYATQFSDDISGVKLQMYARDTKAAVTADTVVQYFEVYKKKGIRIRNSVGMAFTFFAANNKSYVITDGVLKSGPKDLFTPVLSTFIHFYPGNSGSFKLGGAFGFGIPLQGDKKDVNFMLGLSSILGRNDAIMLSAGVAGAKVNKLIGGYKDGDATTETDVDNVTSQGYALGGFFSLSFNLGNIIQGK